jgi:hypothetical protein
MKKIKFLHLGLCCSFIPVRRCSPFVARSI